jgi:hypothetical protein
LSKIGQAAPGTRHEPKPIAAFTEGLSLAAEPWLSPNNAFREMVDARIFRGQLEKRSGTSRFAESGIQAAQAPVNYHDAFSPTGDYNAYYTGVPDSRKIVPESCLFTSLNGASPTITASIAVQRPVWQTPAVAAGTIPPLASFGTPSFWHWVITADDSANTVLGSFWWADENTTFKCLAYVNWFLHLDNVLSEPAAGAATTMDYWYNPENEIVGLTKYKNVVGENSLCMDKESLFLYDPVEGFYKSQGKDPGGGTVYTYFTGTDEDYFWTWPLADYTVMTNNVDPVHRWNPSSPVATSVTEMPTDWVSGAPGTDQLTTCLIVLRFKGRLLYFNTSEVIDGLQPTRVRWTGAGSFTVWNSSLDYLDAPNELGSIVTAQFIAERLFVGFEKGWMELVSTGDAILPFKWREFISRFGAVSKMSTIKDNERLLSKAKTTMQGLDPNGQYYIDQAIPDYHILEYNQDAIDLCSAVRNEDQRGFWWTYVEPADTRPNNVLCATYDEEGNLSWSKYAMRFNSFAEFDSDQSPTWDDLGPETWDDYPTTAWDSASVGSAGTTNIIGGTDKGLVCKFDASLTDFRPDGPGTIAFDITSQDFAPYPMQNAHWGWVDFYMRASEAALLTLYFYSNKREGAYLTKTISLAPSGLSEKIYRRVTVDRTAAFHKFRIQNSDGRPICIDAIVPWFRPAGRIKGFN